MLLALTTNNNTLRRTPMQRFRLMKIYLVAVILLLALAIASLT
jgi:hypothetical protein